MKRHVRVFVHIYVYQLIHDVFFPLTCIRIVMRAGMRLRKKGEKINRNMKS